MPLYEYECSDCGKRFELLQKFSAPPQATCEACGGISQRLLSVPAIQFKGSGWYVTDYGRKSTPADKGEGKGEEKAAAKTDGKPSSAQQKEKKSPTSPASKSD